MKGDHDAAVDRAAFEVDSFPGGIAPGSTVLVASAGDPSQYAVGLHLLCQYGDADDVGLVVTTTESAKRTIETFERRCDRADRSSLRLVDTASERQSVSAPYGETPIVYTPASSDIERLVLALAELSVSKYWHGTQHLIVQSLTPILEATSLDRTRHVLDRMLEFRETNGIAVLGLDYTAHDERTMNVLAGRADGVLWVTQTPSDQIAFEYRPTGSHYQSSSGDATPE